MNFLSGYDMIISENELFYKITYRTEMVCKQVIAQLSLENMKFRKYLTVVMKEGKISYES